MQSSKGASSALSGQTATTQAQTWTSGTSARGNAVTQEQTTGAREVVSGRAVVSVEASGHTAQGVELSPKSVLDVGVDSETQADE